MEGHEHRKKAKHNRNGRNRYEKGRRHHQTPIKGKNMLPHKKGDWANLKHNPERPFVTLGDVWPKTT